MKVALPVILIKALSSVTFNTYADSKPKACQKKINL